MSADGADRLAAALRSPAWRERLHALDCLVAEPRPLRGDLRRAVLACLAASVKELQRRAVDVLRATDAVRRPEVVAWLRAACRGDDPRLRWGAAYALGRSGVLDVALVAPLIEALAQRDGDQRWAAADLLVACGRAHADLVVPALLDALADDGGEQRKMALYVLRDLSPAKPESAAAFMRSLADPERAVRLAALSGLCRVDPPPEGACERVLRMARDDPDAGVRRAATSALGIVGRGVAAAGDAIAAAAAAGDAGLRRAADAARRRLAASRS